MTYFCQFIYYRFLATVDCYSTIANSFRVGSSTIVEIVRTTCLALWDVLQPTVMRPPKMASNSVGFREELAISKLLWDY